jgi:hypothetical protein
MHTTTFAPVSSAPRLEGGKPVFDTASWLRLPRPGSRCPVSNLSRSTLAELVRPCPRNGYRPPVEARLLKRRDARRGVLLISRDSLLGYLNELPPPDSATSPANVARAAAALAALREADCALIDARADLTDTAKTSIKAEIRAGKFKASDVAQPEVSQ